MNRRLPCPSRETSCQRAASSLYLHDYQTLERHTPTPLPTHILTYTQGMTNALISFSNGTKTMSYEVGLKNDRIKSQTQPQKHSFK